MKFNWKPGMTLWDVEREFIRVAVDHFFGNKSRTARALGISVRTVHNKIRAPKKPKAKKKGKKAPKAIKYR